MVAALRAPGRYPHPVERVELLETHISWVMLTGRYAYKLKKPLALGFLDFSTLDARRRACEDELRLNRRTAPELYLEVVPVTGTPTIAGAALTSGDRLGAGEWLVTDAFSKAELSVGRIGTAEVGPNSRVHLDRGGWTQHRLTLERGRLQVVISAPPRLFLVRTPSVLATDLGCAYTLEVDSAGTSRLHVTAGWVELKQGDAVSLVPAGLVAEVAVGGRPGTPYAPELPADARAALRRLEAGTGDAADLELLSAGLHGPSEFITLRRQSGITLWHLLQRVGPELRQPVYQRLAELSDPPAGVTREGILALQRPMLERWRRDLSPMWSEEAQSWWTRTARRLWDWTIN